MGVDAGAHCGCSQPQPQIPTSVWGPNADRPQGTLPTTGAPITLGAPPTSADLVLKGTAVVTSLHHLHRPCQAPNPWWAG